jgi:hypothetical protein
MTVFLIDDGEAWFADIMQNHLEEARQRASQLLAAGVVTETGCIVTPTAARRKVRFNGRQTTAYRFMLCVMTQTAASFDEVVRHRCHNGLCINPDHLEFGSRAENKHDDWQAAAYGVDFDLI